MAPFIRLFAPMTALAFAAPVLAQDNKEGTSEVTVVQSSAITAVDSLRFGAFYQPATAGIIRIDPEGRAFASTGVFGSANIPQPNGQRGAASFRVQGQANTQFLVRFPAQFDIRNGAATMQVNRTRSSALDRGGNNGSSAQFDDSGVYILTVGGDLNVKANQAYGSYSGQFEVTVNYL